MLRNCECMYVGMEVCMQLCVTMLKHVGVVGYVGRGMLSAAVCGAVFTSPPPSSILSAIRVVGKGSAGEKRLFF